MARHAAAASSEGARGEPEDDYNDCSESEQKLLTRDEKEAEVKAVNAKLKVVKPMPAPDRYGTIVIDPPWEMEKIKRDVRPNRVRLSDNDAEELGAFPVAQMAAGA